MTLYILKLYASEHKMRGECNVAGYYTNKTALIREFKKHIDEVGEYWSTAHGVKSIEDHAKYDFRYFDSDFANIEIEEVNTWTA